jgi:hypothetical protein
VTGFDAFGLQPKQQLFEVAMSYHGLQALVIGKKPKPVGLKQAISTSDPTG